MRNGITLVFLDPGKSREITDMFNILSIVKGLMMLKFD